MKYLRLLSILTGLGLLSLDIFAASVGDPGVYINGNQQAAPGTLTTNDYSKGSGAANPNTVDHAIYADTSATALVVSNAAPGSVLASQVSTGIQAYADVRTFSNALKSTTLGAEGMRMVGAAGGYTLEELLEDTYPRGASRDAPEFTYVMSPTANLNVSWTGGDVYDPVIGYYHLTSGSNVLTDNAVNYAYWTRSNPQEVLWTTGTRADVSNSINIATFVCAFGRIIHVGDTVPVPDMPLRMDEAHFNVMPSLIVNGLNYVSIGTNFNDIAQVGGTEFHNLVEKNIHPAKVLTNYNLLTGSFLLAYAHTNASAFGLAITNRLPVDKWDNGTNLVSCTLSNWYRGVFISAAGSPSMGWVYPQAEYTNYESALAADDPTLPNGFDPYIPKCTAYIFQGGDTELRTSGDSWLDRRFMIRRGSIATGGSGSGTTPSLYQVLLQSADTGGILPYGAGAPSQPGQLANKGYVDSTINQINGNKAYVDADSGNDGTALLDSSIKPFKTIQAAINAAAVVASVTDHYTVVISGGVYSENITMKNFVGIRSDDIEGTRIHGTVTFPPAYTDPLGSEVALLSIISSNTPAIVMNAGDDSAYMGVRACYLSSRYDNGQSNKSVILINRGLGETYGTSYTELTLAPTNGSGDVRHAQLFEHTTDPANPGLSQFTSFNTSGLITSGDTNDDVSLIYTHDNTDAQCINTLMGSVVNVHLDVTNDVYTGTFKSVNHEDAQGRTLSKDSVVRLYLGYTNAVNVFFGYAAGGTTDNVAIVRGNHIRMPAGSTSNVWLGAAVGSNDRLRVYDSVYIQNFSDMPYPRIYTNAGAAGKFFVNTVTENGDHLFGSAMDLSSVNSTEVSTPNSGHLKIYASPYAGLENPMFKDSSGNLARFCRDNFYNGFNADTTDMKVGDAIYMCEGLSSPHNTPKIKKSIANNPSTMPAIGLVCQNGGIATGQTGRIMFFGRLEAGMDTSMFTSGDKLYVSDTVLGGITNVAPTGSSIAQQIGTCHLSNTNGYVNVRPWAMDTLGGLTPNKYVTNNQTSVSFGTITGNGAAVSNVDASTVGGYTAEQLQTAGATYYIWGSLAGPFTNPASKMAKLDSPAAQPVWTSIVTGASVTNGLLLGYASIRTNEAPRYLEGRQDIHVQLERDGSTADRTMRVYRKVYEADQTTVVDTVVGGTKTIPNSKGDITFTIAPTNVVNITDAGRVIVYYFQLVSGWTGTETLKVYSQDSELTYISFASTPGVFVPQEEYTSDRVNWDNAYIIAGVASNIATFGSNGVVAVNSSTGTWNAASVNATWASNGVVTLNSSTGTWNAASVNATWASNGVVTLNSSTGTWNAASVNATWASNGVVAVNSRTGLWNTVGSVSNSATFGSNGVVTLNGSTGSWNAAYSHSVVDSASSLIYTNPTSGISIGASAAGSLAFTSSISLATSSNYIVRVNGLAAFTGAAGNSRGVDAYIYLSTDSGFAVSNLIGRAAIIGAQLSPQTNMVNGWYYARNLTNSQIKVDYRMTSTANGAGTFTNFDILMEPK